MSWVLAAMPRGMVDRRLRGASSGRGANLTLSETVVVLVPVWLVVGWLVALLLLLLVLLLLLLRRVIESEELLAAPSTVLASMAGDAGGILDSGMRMPVGDDVWDDDADAVVGKSSVNGGRGTTTSSVADINYGVVSVVV